MRKVDAFQLKLIAIIAMFINHLGHTFELEWTHPLWQFFYLTIGFFTFPTMAYLLVEGFFYTRNRWKYAGRLAVFWLLSILPFQYVFHPNDSWINPVNNIMFTLLMGIILLMLSERFPQPSVQCLFVFLFVIVTIQSDWNGLGIPIIFAFYKLRGQKNAIRDVLAIAAMALFLLSFPREFQLWSSDMMVCLSSLGLLLVIPLLQAYNGQRGYSPKWVKWGFYAFYPLHLSILVLIRYLLFGY